LILGEVDVDCGLSADVESEMERDRNLEEKLEAASHSAL
jgi:hypothetical protein